MEILLQELKDQRLGIANKLSLLHRQLEDSNNLNDNSKLLGEILSGIEQLQRSVEQLNSQAIEIITLLNECQKSMTDKDRQLLAEADRIQPIDWGTVSRLICQTETKEAAEILRITQNTLYRKEQAKAGTL
nr:hypothetical protein [uncultured Draconibacterium sp.]